MLYTLVEDSLEHTEGSNRFKLVHEAVKLARSAPIDTSDKPVIWALQSIAKDPHQAAKTLIAEQANE